MRQPYPANRVESMMTLYRCQNRLEALAIRCLIGPSAVLVVEARMERDHTEVAVAHR
jgi:hypothetical protein